MKKLLYVASSYGHILSFHIPYIKELQEMGFEVHVAAAGIPMTDTEVHGENRGADSQCANLQGSVAQINIPFEKKMLSPKNLKCTIQLIKLIKEENYDIISVHTSLAAFFVRLAIMCIRKKNPIVINTVHGYLFDEDTPCIKKNILLYAEKLTKSVTNILVVMNQQDYDIAEKYRLYKNKLIKIPGVGIDNIRFSRERVENQLLQQANIEELNNLNVNKRDNDNSDISDIVDGTVDSSIIANNNSKNEKQTLFGLIRELERAKLGISKNDIVLIYAAEFSKRKNQGMLIEAMSKLPSDVKLLLAGKGEKLEECQKMTESLNLNRTCNEDKSRTYGYGGRVQFLGQVKNLECYYYLSDICVSSSRSEGLPFNVMEAMSIGLPVIATNVKGHQDLVENGVNGYLYEFDDKNGFAEAVRGFLQEKHKLKYMAGNNAEKAQNYSFDKVKDKVISVYFTDS